MGPGICGSFSRKTSLIGSGLHEHFCSGGPKGAKDWKNKSRLSYSNLAWNLQSRLAIPAAIYRSAFRARAGKCPPECFLSNVGHLPRSAPKSAFRALFGVFLGLKNAKKHSKSTLWGTPRQVPKIAQKALRGALSGPGPKSTPVNRGNLNRALLIGF